MIQINKERLREHPHGEDHLRILEAVLAAIDPAALLTERLTVVGDALEIDHSRIPLMGRRIWILSIGKAGVPMAQAVESLLGPERIAGGVAVTRTGYGGLTDVVRVIEAGHPIPTDTIGADAIVEVSKQVGLDDLVL